jgi:methionyl-tRNA formyltransferase
MKKMSKPIVFFGSGPVAARSLELLSKNFEIEAVVTKPRAAHHRGEVPVLELAERLSIPVMTASDKKSLDELIDSKPFKSELGILIDFGIIVSQKVIDYFPLGIINSHFSILPEWRGADPITFSVLSGQKSTGVSLMLLTAGMDEGPLLAYGTYELPADITTPLLTEHLIRFSVTLLEREVPRYHDLVAAGENRPASQDITGRKLSYSRKLTKEDGVLDWSKPAEQLEREIRAFLGWPKSRTRLKDLDVVITKTHVVDETGEPGTWVIKDKQPIVYCGSKALVIDMLKPAGKKEMTGEGFLAGYRKLLG